MPAAVEGKIRRVAPGFVPPSGPGAGAHLRTLERIEELIDECIARPDVDRSARNRAYARALALLDESAADGGTARSALIGFACDLTAAIAEELKAALPALHALIQRLESGPGISALELGCALLRAPQLLQLAPMTAIEVELTLLLAFSDTGSVSLWRQSADGQPSLIALAGVDDSADGHSRQLAARLLTGEHVEQSPRSEIAGLTLDSRHGRVALICRGADARPSRDLLLEAAAPALALALGRTAHLSPATTGDGPHRPTGLTAAERRLARVRFDLHDGPQQDLILLAEDLRLFRSQVDTVLSCDETRALVLGRFDDLEARLTALEGDLRRISVSTESPFLHRESLAQAVARVADAFEERSGIKPLVQLHGDLTSLTDSQHLTLLSLIREALANIHEHARAQRVKISVSAAEDGVSACVADDGRGFKPETMLVEAARHGRLGLVGMHERVHMLGGRTQIDSCPGGPTVICVSLPPAPFTADVSSASADPHCATQS